MTCSGFEPRPDCHNINYWKITDFSREKLYRMIEYLLRYRFKIFSTYYLTIYYKTIHTVKCFVLTYVNDTHSISYIMFLLVSRTFQLVSHSEFVSIMSEMQLSTPQASFSHTYFELYSFVIFFHQAKTITLSPTFELGSL
jgi:hypothetical protein